MTVSVQKPLPHLVVDLPQLGGKLGVVQFGVVDRDSRQQDVFIADEAGRLESFERRSAVGLGQGDDVLRLGDGAFPAADAGLADARFPADFARRGRSGDACHVIPPGHGVQLMRTDLRLPARCDWRGSCCPFAHDCAQCAHALGCAHMLKRERSTRKETTVNATLRLRRDRLEEHRARLDLTTETRLANAMGADRGTVNKVLNGKAQAGPDFIASIVALPGVRFDDVWEIIAKESA